MVGQMVHSSAFKVEGLAKQVMEVAMSKNRPFFSDLHASQVGPLGINKWVGYRYVINAAGLARSHWRLGPFLVLGAAWVVWPAVTPSFKESIGLGDKK